MNLYRCGTDNAYEAKKRKEMNDIDFVRITAMLVLPKLLETSVNPAKDAVDCAMRLLEECQKRENL